MSPQAQVRPGRIEVRAPRSLAVVAQSTPEPPTLESFAADLYDSVLPVAWLDHEYGFHLAYYCAAIAVMFQPVADVARDTPDGPGWSGVMDVNRAPVGWLGWLAQFVGVSLVPGTTHDEQVARIKSTDGFRRGTVAAMRSAIELHLTGSKEVVFTERLDGDAYVLGIRTLEAETPDPAQTLADILSQKPGGIVLDYATYSSQNYDLVHVERADYTEVHTVYATYSDLRSDNPS